MMHHVIVRQITDKNGDAFMNVRNGAGHVRVQVHNYQYPTYLLTKRNFVNLIQFASQEWADEMLQEYADNGWTIIPLDDLMEEDDANA